LPIFYNQGAMQTELILAGNGPGELAGWIRPTAEAAKAAARTNGQPVRLTLALLPTQFAGGTELDTARSWNLFDRILPPGDCLRLAAGVGSLEVSPHAVLVHLGGDPWLSGRLADVLTLQTKLPVASPESESVSRPISRTTHWMSDSVVRKLVMHARRTGAPSPRRTSDIHAIWRW